MAATQIGEKPKKVLDTVLESLELSPSKAQQTALVQRRPPATTTTTDKVGDTGSLVFYHEEIAVPEEDRVLNSLAALLVNAIDNPGGKDDDLKSIRTIMSAIDRLSLDIDKRISEHIHVVLRDPVFRELERNWRSLDELCGQVESSEVIIDFLDATKEELGSDFEDHASDVLTSALFKKVYIDEYDRFGGRPFGAMVGLYEFDSSDEDVDWLRIMSKICSASHAPFVGGVAAQFFGFKSFDELAVAGHIEDLMNHPKYGKWEAFRDSDAAAYIGLVLPRYLMRKPWDQASSKNPMFNFDERIRGSEDYLWGNSVVLFARNMIRSFEMSGWCQHITGPRGGGLIQGLPVHVVQRHGQEEIQPPVEIAIPDYRELQFAKCGFIPLVHRKGSAEAAFFSARAIKRALVFESELDTQNADLVCNLAYTFSITRIAHYVKRMVRDYIGSTADGPYIQGMLERWLIDYVTTAVNPDDLTLLYYPFKAMSVSVEPKPGPLGWYKCVISVLPHIQFQGMDVELRLEAALGGA